MLVDSIFQGILHCPIRKLVDEGSDDMYIFEERRETNREYNPWLFIMGGIHIEEAINVILFF